jgi:hypothetical protein
VRQFFGFAGAQTLNYIVLVMNMRAVASGNIPVALVTDAFYAAVYFTIIEKIAHSKPTKAGRIGYVVGSLIGTYVGMQF